MPENESTKKEYRIDSSDSARPPATLESETAAYAQGLKGKARIITDVSYEELDQTIPRGKDSLGHLLPPAKMILKTVTYDDGLTIDTTVGEDNYDYRQYLAGLTKTTKEAQSTRRHTPTRKPTKPVAKEAAKGKG